MREQYIYDENNEALQPHAFCGDDTEAKREQYKAWIFNYYPQNKNYNTLTLKENIIQVNKDYLFINPLVGNNTLFGYMLLFYSEHCLYHKQPMFLKTIANSLSSILVKYKTQAALAEAKHALEEKVQERTRALMLANQELDKQNIALRESFQLRDDIEQITRHDLKTPLNSMINLPQLLLMDKNLTQRQRDALKMIEEVSYQMLNMINLSLDLYKIEVGNYKFNPAMVDLEKIINKVIQEVDYIIEDRKIHIILYRQIELSTETLFVQAEASLCYSLFGNLLQNALEASPNETDISILLNSCQQYYCVSIHNQGAVPEEIRDTFFNKYSTYGKQHGTGLGTYSAKLITELQEGLISVDTSEPEATTVKVCLLKTIDAIS